MNAGTCKCNIFRLWNLQFTDKWFFKTKKYVVAKKTQLWQRMRTATIIKQTKRTQNFSAEIGIQYMHLYMLQLFGPRASLKIISPFVEGRLPRIIPQSHWICYNMLWIKYGTLKVSPVYMVYGPRVRSGYLDINQVLFFFVFMDQDGGTCLTVKLHCCMAASSKD